MAAKQPAAFHSGAVVCSLESDCQGLEGILDESEDEEEEDNINEAACSLPSGRSDMLLAWKHAGRHGHRGCQEDRESSKKAEKGQERASDALMYCYIFVRFVFDLKS